MWPDDAFFLGSIFGGNSLVSVGTARLESLTCYNNEHGCLLFTITSTVQRIVLENSKGRLEIKFSRRNSILK